MTKKNGEDYSVHICCVGSHVDPCMAVTRSNMGISKVWLVGSRRTDSLDERTWEKLEDTSREVERRLRDCGIAEIGSKKVDAWDYQGIIDEVIDIAERERAEHPNARFYINFTSGTHVMAGAMCSAAFCIGASIYYVMNRGEHPDLSSENETRLFEIPYMPDISSIGLETRRVLSRIDPDKGTANRDIVEEGREWSKQYVGYHTRRLRELGLIEGIRSGKEVKWRLTYPGRIAARLLGITTQPVQRV